MDSERPPSTSRRRLLALAATAGSVAASGCASALPPLGQQIRFGRVDAPGGGSPTYRRWVPPASELPWSSWGVMAGNPGSLVPTTTRARFVTGMDWFGTPFDDYDRAVGIDVFRSESAYVFEGSTGPDVVADALEDTGYERTGSYDGYVLYAREDGPRTVAAGEDAVVFADSGDGRSVVEAILDARAGRIPRRHEANDAFGATSGGLGRRDYAYVGFSGITLPDTPEPVEVGHAYSYRDDAYFLRSVSLYERPDEVPIARIRRKLRESTHATQADAVEVRKDGRRAIVEMRTNQSPYAWPDTSIPQITWGVSREGGSVTVRHEAGEAVEADRIDVTVQYEVGRTDRWNLEEQFDTIEPGDSITVDVQPEDGPTVVVYFDYGGSLVDVFGAEL